MKARFWLKELLNEKQRISNYDTNDKELNKITEIKIIIIGEL